MKKGESACYKQFFLFSQCFPQLYIFSASKCVMVNLVQVPTKSMITHYQTTNFRLFQTERVCRRQFQI